MKYRARRGKIPAELMHHEIPNDTVPPGLSDEVEVTIWHQHGDHPDVLKVPPSLHASGEKVETSPGVWHFIMEPFDAITRNIGPDGQPYDHIVKPGYAIVKNRSDGKVWAISPHHLRAWFETSE